MRYLFWVIHFLQKKNVGDCFQSEVIKQLKMRGWSSFCPGAFLERSCKNLSMHFLHLRLNCNVNLLTFKKIQSVYLSKLRQKIDRTNYEVIREKNRHDEKESHDQFWVAIFCVGFFRFEDAKSEVHITLTCSLQFYFSLHL